jgi:hypothetical protein
MLRVEDVFYIKTIDRVIDGFVSSCTVKPGDQPAVRSGGTAIPVTVERLEHPQLKLECIQGTAGRPGAARHRQGPGESRSFR